MAAKHVYTLDLEVFVGLFVLFNQSFWEARLLQTLLIPLDFSGSIYEEA